ncbi:UNVERIFIED_CONTAM: recombinase family protein [Kocuria sp. CPCC 205316]
MAGTEVGYARVSTVEQDLTVQREALLRPGVTEDRIYVDHGLTGAHRGRPGHSSRISSACAPVKARHELPRWAPRDVVEVRVAWSTGAAC